MIAASNFEKKGIMINAGDCRANKRFSSLIKAKLEFLISNKEYRTELSLKMQELVDGMGARRICKDLLIH